MLPLVFLPPIYQFAGQQAANVVTLLYGLFVIAFGGASLMRYLGRPSVPWIHGKVAAQTGVLLLLCYAALLGGLTFCRMRMFTTFICLSVVFGYTKLRATRTFLPSWTELICEFGPVLAWVVLPFATFIICQTNPGYQAFILPLATIGWVSITAKLWLSVSRERTDSKSTKETGETLSELPGPSGNVELCSPT